MSKNNANIGDQVFKDCLKLVTFLVKQLFWIFRWGFRKLMDWKRNRDAQKQFSTNKIDNQ